MGRPECWSLQPRSKRSGRRRSGSRQWSSTPWPRSAGSLCSHTSRCRVAVRVDAFAIRLRRRSGMEAADMGVRLCQSVARSLYTCLAIVAVPCFAFALAAYEIRSWIPTLALWWMKPWLDRTILFVLSRAAFGQHTSVGDLWRAKRQVWFGQFLRTLTLRRLSPWRSFTQPVYQLEGQHGSKLAKRVRQIRSGHTGAALLATTAFSLMETFVLISLLALVSAFSPKGSEPDFFALFNDTASDWMRIVVAFVYAAVIFALEPFYVAIGFALYLNRRVELE